jgi:hypothetical protein
MSYEDCMNELLRFFPEEERGFVRTAVETDVGPMLTSMKPEVEAAYYKAKFAWENR